MRRALIIGIDDYPSAQLHGCVNDAKAVRDRLIVHEDGGPNFDCRLVVSSEETVTRNLILERLDDLLSTEADVALLYFSGHGASDDNDGYLVPQDWSDARDGVRMIDVLQAVERSPVREVLIMLDCCHSGRFGDVPFVGDSAVLKEGVSILTASRRDQASVETNGAGVFTSLLCGALDGGAADVLGTVTLAGVYAYLDESLGAWDQRPLFKTHVSRLVPLRKCAPAVPRETLRRLQEWFATADSEFPLDPSFEPDAPPKDPVHEAIFDQLQKCRAAKLVEPVGAEHMYFAAMNSTACRLTQLGRHYWRLAKEGRI
jgi:hypothetical protein